MDMKELVSVLLEARVGRAVLPLHLMIVHCGEP